MSLEKISFSNNYKSTLNKLEAIKQLLVAEFGEDIVSIALSDSKLVIRVSNSSIASNISLAKKQLIEALEPKYGITKVVIRQ